MIPSSACTCPTRDLVVKSESLFEMVPLLCFCVCSRMVLVKTPNNSSVRAPTCSAHAQLALPESA